MVLVGLDEWVFPKGGFLFAWTLEEDRRIIEKAEKASRNRDLLEKNRTDRERNLSMTDADLRNIEFTHWLQQKGLITKSDIFDAFKSIPRHKFLPDLDLDKVYKNETIVTKRVDRRSVSSATKPSVVADMLEQLELQKGQNVLEIGTGTGYNAALISHIVGSSGCVVSLDIDPEIIQAAKEKLAFFKFDNLLTVCADGWFGYSAMAPFDRIIFTVGINDIPTFWQEQLKEDGVLLAPLWFKNGIQRTVALKKHSDMLVSQSISKWDFLPLRGPMAGPGAYTFLDDNSDLITGVEDEQRDEEYLARLFSLVSAKYVEQKLSKADVLSGKELEEFIFYAGLRGANCLLLTGYEAKDSFFSEPALGIYNPVKQSMFIIKYNHKRCELSRKYNSDEAMKEYFSLFKKWVSKGKPGDSNISVIVLPKEQLGETSFEEEIDSIILERKSCFIIYKIKRDF